MPKKTSSTNKKKKNTVSAKGAYAPKAKSNFKKMSNPFAENKQVLGSELSLAIGTRTNNGVARPILTDYSLPPIDHVTEVFTGAPGHVMNTPHWIYSPDSALYQTHGLDENQMVGRSTYQVLTKAKFLIKWPQPSMSTGILDDNDNLIMGRIPSRPMTYKVYWGRVPLKYLLSGSTDPKASEVSAVQLENRMNQRINDYFNQRRDRIQFISKTSATLHIEGSKVLKPPWDSTTGKLPVAGDYSDAQHDDARSEQHGTIPDTLFSVTWKTNKKIHFEPTNKFATNASGEPDSPDNNATVFYRNYSGQLPFVCIVSFNHDDLPENGEHDGYDTEHERTRRCPQILANDITYYRDS